MFSFAILSTTRARLFCHDIHYTTIPAKKQALFPEKPTAARFRAFCPKVFHKNGEHYSKTREIKNPMRPVFGSHGIGYIDQSR
ncbi:MAG: hypothetical protein IJC52_06150, partial [Clostridia bacterium]|nr:hypothetical protein [Clostridia bacterium]